MHIFIIFRERIHEYGAAINYYKTLAKGFKANEVSSSLISLNYPPRGNFTKGRIEGINYRYLLRGHKTSLVNRFSQRLFLYPAIIFNICQCKLKYTDCILLFIVDNPLIIYISSKLSKYLKIPYYLLRTEIPSQMKVYNDMKIITNRLRKCYNNVSNLLVETKKLKEVYQDICRNDTKIQVFPTVIDCTDILQFQRNSNQEYLAFCGVISNEDKDGLLTLIKAFKLFNNKYPLVSFYIVGKSQSSEYYNELKQEVVNLNLFKNIIFTGPIERTDYIQYLVNAAILVNGKKRESRNSYGISSKVIEYLYSGNPVIMSASDEFYEYLRDREEAYFIYNDDPYEFYNAFIYLYENFEIRKTMGQKGKEAAMRLFDYQLVTKKMINYMEQR